MKIKDAVAADHPCFDPDGPPDHDIAVGSDSTGDPGVINGTQSWNFYKCRRCLEEFEDEVDYADLCQYDE